MDNDRLRVKTRNVLLAGSIVLGLSILPGLALAFFGLISLILGHESAIATYVIELAMLSYPLVAAVAIALSWWLYADRAFKRSMAVLFLPLVNILLLFASGINPTGVLRALQQALGG